MRKSMIANREKTMALVTYGLLVEYLEKNKVVLSDFKRVEKWTLFQPSEITSTGMLATDLISPVIDGKKLSHGYNRELLSRAFEIIECLGFGVDVLCVDDKEFPAIVRSDNPGKENTLYVLVAPMIPKSG